MSSAYVYLDSGIVVENADKLTEEEIIHNASEQIRAQLEIDHDAFAWIVEEED